jgi:hypothetical protein
VGYEKSLVNLTLNRLDPDEGAAPGAIALSRSTYFSRMECPGFLSWRTVLRFGSLHG